MSAPHLVVILGSLSIGGGIGDAHEAPVEAGVVVPRRAALQVVGISLIHVLLASLAQKVVVGILVTALWV